MKVKLLKSVLVGPADVIATRGGTTVDLADDEARLFIEGGLAEAVGGEKTASTPANKSAVDHDSKAAPPVSKPTQEGHAKK